MSRFLFVYGTLRRNQGNPFAVRLERWGAWLGPARLRGRLYALAHYPGAVGEPLSAGYVRGEVYRLPRRDHLLRFLDAYEGPEFQRRLAPVRLASGSTVRAWYYAYTGPTAGAQRIPAGDYLDWVRRTGRASDWPLMITAAVPGKGTVPLQGQTDSGTTYGAR